MGGETFEPHPGCADMPLLGRAEPVTNPSLSVWRQMDAKDQPPPYLIFMLVRQYRQLILAQAMLREGRSQQQVLEIRAPINSA